MIKTYTYSMVAIVPVENEKALLFLEGLCDDETRATYYDGEDTITIHAHLDVLQYKLLYVLDMNKDSLVTDCFITFKNLGNTLDTTMDHILATQAHYELVRIPNSAD